MTGKEAQAEEALEFPKGLCPDEADRPEGPSLAPIGRLSPFPGTEAPDVFAAPAALIAEFAPPLSPPLAPIPTAIPPIDIPPIPAAEAGAVNAQITLAVTNESNTLARLNIAVTSLIFSSRNAVISLEAFSRRWLANSFQVDAGLQRGSTYVKSRNAQV